jgi:heme/copper-type cytochrome/quinol oxidase subunit 2
MREEEEEEEKEEEEEGEEEEEEEDEAVIVVTARPIVLLACNDVPAHEVFQIIGTEMEYRGQRHRVYGALAQHIRCSSA